MGGWMRIAVAAGLLAVTMGCSSAKLPAVRRDGGAGTDLGEPADVEVPDGFVADDGVPDDAEDSGRDGGVGDGGLGDGGDVDAGDGGVTVDVNDAGTAGDAGVQMTFTFVSAALNSAPGAPVQMHAQIVWHGALRGQSADGRIRFEGVIQ